MSKSPRDIVEARERTGAASIPGYLDRLELFEQQRAEIDEQPFVSSELARRRAALDAAVWRDLDTLVEAALTPRMRDLDTAIGRVRQQIIEHVEGPTAVQRGLRAQEFANRAANALASDEVSAVLDEAALTDDDRVVGAVVSAGRKRLSDLIAAVRTPAQRDAANAALLAFETRARDWVRDHPSPSSRLAQIERERGNVKTSIEMAAGFASAMYGLKRPTHREAPEPSDSATDVLAGRRRAAFRR